MDEQFVMLQTKKARSSEMSIKCRSSLRKSLWSILEMVEKTLSMYLENETKMVVSQWCCGESEDHMVVWSAHRIWGDEKGRFHAIEYEGVPE